MKKLFLIPLLACFSCVMAWATDVNSYATLKAALEDVNETLVTLTAPITISDSDAAIQMVGTKTVNFNGQTITAANWKLEVRGTGTITFEGTGGITTGKGCLDVYSNVIINGGTFTTSVVGSGAAIWINGSSEIVVNDININASDCAINSDGNGGRIIVNGGTIASETSFALQTSSGYIEINGGTITSNSSTKHKGANWAYAVISKGTFVMNGGTISGVQGGLCVKGEGTTATINDGVFETRACAYGGPSHYSIYVCEHAVANVYGGKFKSYDKTAMLCGNNDATQNLGVINFYGGKSATKATVSKVPSNNTFPASIPATSQWYSSITVGSDNYGMAPLPAGYEYYDITEGEDFEAGYRYGVRPVAGKEADGVSPAQQAAQEADPTYTIPWQQSTTWATAEVPEDNTIVTIPKDATVTVSKDEETKTAVADQVYVSQGATLKVEEGTTLNIGEGGMNIGNGGKLVVEPGAIVKVGDAGIITTDNEALVIEATETDQAVLLYDPTVPQNENTQPQATVKLTTKSKMLNNSPFQYTYQRFALPIKVAATPENDFDPAIHEYYDATEASYGFESYIYYWNSRNWANCKWNALVPFKGYQLANNSKNGGVVYTFKGNLIGNEDGEYNFAEYGFDYFGNSYTAPINVETFLSGFGSDVEATIWLYNYGMSNWQQVSLEDFSDFGVDPEYQQIKSMDGFLLNLRAASGSANVNYNDAIWSNPLLGSSPSLAPARRVANSNLSNSAVITVVEANGHGDAVTLVEKATRSNEFENGADASKYMTEEGLSLYAETNAGQLSRVATNDLSNTVLTFRAGNETNYSLTIDKAQGEDYILRDNVTGNTIALTNGATYNFTQAANTTVPARFEVIGIAKMPTAIDNIEAAANASGIYTVTGQFLGHDFTNLPAGVYVVNGVKIVK